MNRLRIIACLVLAISGSPYLQAQLPVAELHSIHPPAIAIGQSTEIRLFGSHLEELEGLHSSAPGIKAKKIAPDRFLVTVPKDSRSASIPVRAVGHFGLSTSCPLRLVPAATKLIADSAGKAHHQLDSAPLLEHDSIAYGTTDSNQIDWWKFQVRKGQRLLIHCRAERLQSQADATLKVVDGRGYEMSVSRDKIGRDPMIDFTAPMDGFYWVGVFDVFYRGGPNYLYTLEVTSRPWIDSVFPLSGAAGKPQAFTIFGRNLPGTPSKSVDSSDHALLDTVEKEIPVPPQSDATFSFEYSAPDPASIPVFPLRHEGSNPVAIGLASAPVVCLPEDHSKQATVPFPSDISARFDHPNDVDRYRFQASKGKKYWIEVVGNRIDRSVDPYLLVEKVIVDKSGNESFKKVSDEDDGGSPGGALFPAVCRDPSILLASDHDGEYRVTVLNQFGSGSRLSAYRLVIREPRPDFSVYAISERPYLENRQAFPAVPLLRRGGSFSMRLILDRREGFAGAVQIEAGDLPAGIEFPPVTLSEKETNAQIAFLAGKEAPPGWAGRIDLIARSKTEPRIQKSVPMGILLRGTSDYNLNRLQPRLEPQISLAVSEHEPTPASLQVENTAFTVSLGDKLDIPIQLGENPNFNGSLTITPVGLTGLRKPPTVSLDAKKSSAVLQLDFSKRPGTFEPKAGRWNFILKGTGTTSYRYNEAAVKRAEAELKELTETEKRIDTEVKQAAAGVNTAEAKIRDSESSEAELESVQQLRQELERQRSALKELQDSLKSVATNKASVAKRLEAARKKAAPKNLKFAVWSRPLVVEVTEATEQQDQ